MNTGRDSQSPDSAWRSYNDRNQETLNGDATYSSLAAKGFRSVRPNLQEKKSPTQVILHTLVYCVMLKHGYQTTALEPLL